MVSTSVLLRVLGRGNRIRHRHEGVGLFDGDVYYHYNNANELTVTGLTADFQALPVYYHYDANGSLIKKDEPLGGLSPGTTYFFYNPAGLPASVTWKDGSMTYFSYDGRLSRYRIASDEAYFTWDGGKLLEKRDAGGLLLEQYTYTPTAETEAGATVQVYRPQEAAEDQLIYPAFDLTGAARKWVKDDGTTVLASREYDAFGNIIASTGGWPTPFGFLGWIQIQSDDGSQSLLLGPDRIYLPEEGIVANGPEIGQIVPVYYQTERELKLIESLGKRLAEKEREEEERLRRRIEELLNPYLFVERIQKEIQQFLKDNCICMEVSIRTDPADNTPTVYDYKIQEDDVERFSGLKEGDIVDKIGVKIITNFEVLGDAGKCKFYQDESGRIETTRDLGGNFSHTGLKKGEKRGAVQIVRGKKGGPGVNEITPKGNSFTHTDALGSWVGKNAEGTMIIKLIDFKARGRCVSSLGQELSSDYTTAINMTINVDKVTRRQPTITGTTEP